MQGYECTSCRRHVELDAKGEFARNHRRKKGGPWCEGSGRAKAFLQPIEVTHDGSCVRSGRWYKEKACNEFSTDGTAVGATIAHLYGTSDEEEILRIQEAERLRERDEVLTGMDEEQADWES